MKRRIPALALALAATLLLTACGVRGGLERPPPIWGEDQRTSQERAHEEDEGR